MCNPSEVPGLSHRIHTHRSPPASLRCEDSGRIPVRLPRWVLHRCSQVLSSAVCRYGSYRLRKDPLWIPREPLPGLFQNYLLPEGSSRSHSWHRYRTLPVSLYRFSCGSSRTLPSDALLCLPADRSSPCRNLPFCSALPASLLPFCLPCSRVPHLLSLLPSVLRHLKDPVPFLPLIFLFPDLPFLLSFLESVYSLR